MSIMITFLPNKSALDDSFRKHLFHFPNGSKLQGTYFPATLFRFLVERQKNVENIIFIAEKNSKWDLVNFFLKDADDKRKELNEQLSILESKLNSTSSFDELNSNVIGIEKLLSATLKTKVRLIVMNNLDNTFEQDDISKLQRKLISDILRNLSLSTDEIYLDITYGNGPFSLLTFGILMPTRYVSVKKLRVYYANIHSSTKTKPVFEFKILEEMIEFDEALANFEQSGDFSKPLPYFTMVDKDRINEIYKEFELNYISQNTSDMLKKIIPKKEIYFLEKVKDELSSIAQAKNVEELSYEKAKFYFVRNQYFKAIPLIFEALVTASTVVLYGRGEEIKKKKKSFGKDHIYKLISTEDRKTYERLRTLRNRMVHGIIEDNNVVIPSDDELRELFKKSTLIFEKLKILIKNGETGIMNKQHQLKDVRENNDILKEEENEDFWI